MQACTSTIVSGKVTKDGRPLLLKNRDTGDLNNHVVQMKGEKYTFLAVAADRDKKVRSVWQGHNEKGFAIINTAAYNMNGKNNQSDINDGTIMRLALGLCATAKDFEYMLDTMRVAGHLKANSNFGVIDAEGAAAYYETGIRGYTKYDVNDSTIAPHGYLIRTNFAFSGDRSLDKGAERYMAATQFMLTAAFSGHLDAEYLIRKLPRFLTHGFTKTNLWDLEPDDDLSPHYVSFEDFIPRYATASSTLIQGVKPGESPLHTVSYTITGNSLTCVVIPLLISDAVPGVVTGDGEDNHSWLCQQGLALKYDIFPNHKGKVSDYVDLGKLINRRGTGILQKTEPLETSIFQRFKPVITDIRDGKSSAKKELAEYYSWVDSAVRKFYTEL